MSPSSKRRPSPARFAASASIAGELSTPTVSPAPRVPWRWAVSEPVPQPRSATRCCPVPRSRATRSWNGWLRSAANRSYCAGSQASLTCVRYDAGGRRRGVRMGGFTTSDGRRLEYSTAGDGPVLVCHPGGPGFSSRYFADLAGLADVRRLVLLDPRGTGGCDPAHDPRDYAIEHYVADLDELRDHLGLDRL